MPIARNLVLPLDRVLVYNQYNFKEYCNSKFGESLGEIMYNYTNDPSIEIFDQNKNLILDGYLEYDDKKMDQRNFFFYRFEKIIRLLEDWIEFKKWRDPIVVLTQLSPVLQDGKQYYYANPGKDRVLLMKALKIKEYEFLEFDRQSLIEKQFFEIKNYWGDHSEQLSLKYNSTIDQFTILNKDNVDEILKFKRTVQWLQNNKTLLEFLHK
jgi:hypothetical protein